MSVQEQTTAVLGDAIGVQCVMVNVTMIVEGGKQTGALWGKVLRSGRDTYTVPIPADVN